MIIGVYDTLSHLWPRSDLSLGIWPLGPLEALLCNVAQWEGAPERLYGALPVAMAPQPSSSTNHVFKGLFLLVSSSMKTFFDLDPKCISNSAWASNPKIISVSRCSANGNSTFSSITCKDPLATTIIDLCDLSSSFPVMYKILWTTLFLTKVLVDPGSYKAYSPPFYSGNTLFSSVGHNLFENGQVSGTENKWLFPLFQSP